MLKQPILAGKGILKVNLSCIYH